MLLRTAERKEATMSVIATTVRDCDLSFLLAIDQTQGHCVTFRVRLSTLINQVDSGSAFELMISCVKVANLISMTTNYMYEDVPTFRKTILSSISSDENEDWLHPILEIFRPRPMAVLAKKSRLYLVPSVFDDEFDPDFAPVATSAENLPELNAWCMNFALNVLEVFAGRRPPTSRGSPAASRRCCCR